MTMSERLGWDSLTLSGLVLWSVGVQLNELLATVGFVVSAASGVALILSGRVPFSARRWWPLWACAASAMFFPVLGGHWPTGTGLARLLDWVLIPGCVAAWSSLGSRHQAWVFGAAALALTLSCVAAGFQYFGVWPGEEFFAPFSFTKIPFARVYEPFESAPGRFMAGGLLFHRLKFANVASLLCLLLFTQRSFRENSRWWMSAAALAFLSVWMFPGARAAAVALTLALGSSALMVARAKERVVVLGALSFVAVILFAASPGLRQRFDNVWSGGERGDRTALNQAGIAALRAHPLTGLGLGRFRVADHVLTSASATAKSHAGKTHNQILTIAVEAGVPTAVFFMISLLLLLRRAWFHKNAPLFSVLVFFVLVSLLHDPLFHAETSLALVLTLTLSLPRPVHQPATEQQHPRSFSTNSPAS
jgi:O-antigen ligase